MRFFHKDAIFPGLQHQAVGRLQRGGRHTAQLFPGAFSGALHGLGIRVVAPRWVQHGPTIKNGDFMVLLVSNEKWKYILLICG